MDDISKGAELTYSEIGVDSRPVLTVYRLEIECSPIEVAVGTLKSKTETIGPSARFRCAGTQR